MEYVETFEELQPKEEGLDLGGTSIDAFESEFVPLEIGQQQQPIPVAEMEATISSLAAQRLGNLTPDEAKEKFGAYYELALFGKEMEIKTDLLNLKFERDSIISGNILSEAADKGDIDLTKMVTEYTYDFETDAFSLPYQEVGELLVENAAQHSDGKERLIKDSTIVDTSVNEIPAPTLSEVFSDMAATKLALSHAIRKRASKLGLHSLGDITKMFIPFYVANGFSQRIKTKDDQFSDWWVGEDIQQQIYKFQGMSVKEQLKTLKDLENFFDNKAQFKTEGLEGLEGWAEGQGNDVMALIYLSYLSDYTTFDYAIENIGQAADTLLVGGVVKPLLKAFQIPRIARKISNLFLDDKLSTASIPLGNRADAADQVVNVTQAVKKGEVAVDAKATEEAADLILNGTVRPTAPQGLGNTAGVSGTVIKKAKEIEAMAQNLVDIDQVDAIADMERIANTYDAKVVSQLNDANKTPIDITLEGVVYENVIPGKSIAKAKSTELKDEVTDTLKGITYTTHYGNKKGEGFINEDIAKAYAKNLKIEGATITSIEDQGAHFIKIIKPIDDASDFITPYKDMKKISGFRSVIGTPSGYVDTASRISGLKTLRIKEQGLAEGKKLVKFVDKLWPWERKPLAEVLEQGRNLQKWYSPSELKYSYNLNDNQILAYEAVRRMDDVLWTISNGALYSRFQRAGFKSITVLNKGATDIGLPRTFNGIVETDKISNPRGKTIYDVTTNKYLDEMSPAQLDKLKKQGYVFVSLGGVEYTDTIKPIQYIIGSASDLKVNSLNIKQLPYVPGGRIEYTGTHFVKHGRIGRTEAGMPIVLKSRTFSNGTFEEATELADSINAGRLVALESQGNKATKGTGTLDTKMSEATKGRYNTVDEFIEEVGDKNLNMPFEAVKDGQELSSIRKAISEDSIIIYDAESIKEANTVQNLINRTVWESKRRRGKRLAGIDTEFAPVLNPIESATKSLDKALEIMSKDKWKARHIEQFVLTYRSILKGTEASSNKTNFAHFVEPEFIDFAKATQAERELINQAKGHRQYITSVLNIKTSDEKWLSETFIYSLANTFNKVSKKIGLPIKHETFENIANADPIRFMRAAAYQVNMGLYNLRQPLVQIQASFLATAADPVNGTRAAALALPMRFMLMSENSQTLSMLAKGAGKLVGLKSEEVTELFQILQKSGTWRMQSGTLVEQATEKGVASSKIAQRFLDYGEIPFLETERVNKITATMSAALRWRKANPKAKVTEEAIDSIVDRSETLLLNMNRVDRAGYQKGIMSVPTQFWSYQARAVEAIVFNTDFTPMERFRMAVAQLGMYGVGGTLSSRHGMRWADVANEMYQERFGEPLPEFAYDTIRGGAIEALLASLDIDVALHHRAGLGLLNSGFVEVAKKFATGDFKEILKIDAAGITVISKVASGIADLIRVTNPADVEFLSKAQWDLYMSTTGDTLRSVVSSWSTAEKAAFALQTGKYLDKQGYTLNGEVSTIEAWAQLFGFEKLEKVNQETMRQLIREHGSQPFRKRVVEQLARELNIWNELSIDNIEKAKNQWERFSNLRKGFLGIFPEHERMSLHNQVLNKVTKGNQKSFGRLIIKYNQLYNTETRTKPEE